MINSVSHTFQRVFESGSERIESLKESFRWCSFTTLLPKESRPTERILDPQGPVDRNLNSKKTKTRTLDPQGPFLQKWNKIFVLSCVVAISLDPLFFYIPVIDDNKKCLILDRNLEITASVLRTFTDMFYIIHIILQFLTGFIAPSSRVFGRGELVKDCRAIAKRYLSAYFLIDILAVLPLPQAVVIAIPWIRGARSLKAKDLLKVVVFFQYIPRVLRIYPLYKEVTRTSGKLTETAWTGAAFNLFLYMLASHVLGAFWYLFSIERETTCWLNACRNQYACIQTTVHCQEDRTGIKDMLNYSCPIQKPDSTRFDFGIFLDALQSGIVESTNFPQKFIYCFWWSLQNLSSLGQGLKTSTYVWEICFAVLISISGLVLFAFLIGNMQTYLQSTTLRLEEMRVKRHDLEHWMSNRLLPENLRVRIRKHEQYKWQETRGVDEENLIQSLPKDLRRDIKRHLCLALLMKVPMIEKMDEQLLDVLCDRLKPVLYTKDSLIVREGDPVEEMLFIMRGELRTSTTNGGRTGFFNLVKLIDGDFCGEEILTWALDPQSSTNLPISTRTVQAISDVEAFALIADDLKFVALQFRRLHNMQLRHTFRYHSLQWRTWAACKIQAAWRRHRRKKLEESLRDEEEDGLQNALAENGGSSRSLGATTYTSRFASNAPTPRSLRHNRATKARMPERVPAMLLQKPAEPDFTADDN
ncbi:hypothetical protein ACH5RR_017233 [Cinchona calisaya]|uniref:Cyclic nucleotide-binding domain-containing protein n=1 Tax=Cinchona calisaya TaxID=153742 RepID=A0ABD2ZY65_9GENT